MGQYYYAFNLDRKEYVKPELLKLMEHSYIGNESVGSVEMLMIEGGRWHKNRVVWGGDYGDMHLHDLKDKEGWPKLYNLIEAVPEDYKYILNHDRELYVEKTPETDELVIHPMPLLIADGNGRGGGDYHGRELDWVGSWTGDKISIGKEIPKNFVKLKYRGFKESR